jgi:hypothetical protein
MDTKYKLCSIVILTVLENSEPCNVTVYHGVAEEVNYCKSYCDGHNKPIRDCMSRGLMPNL